MRSGWQWLWLAAALAAQGLAAAQHSPGDDSAYLAIIIDDIGYQRDTAEALIALPYALSFAVLPEAPHSQDLAQKAWLRGKAVMLHIPMATVNGARLDPGGIDADLPATQIGARLRAHFARFPQAGGMNNHMGSLLTTQALPMQAVMSALAEHQRYFIDSKTHPQSVAFELAKQQGIATAQRDVFLDNVQTPQAIAAQLQKAVDTAQEKGFAIAIGHPYPSTLAVLAQQLPLLDKQVKLVPSYTYLRLLSHNQHEPRHTNTPLWRVKTPWRQGLAR